MRFLCYPVHHIAARIAHRQDVKSPTTFHRLRILLPKNKYTRPTQRLRLFPHSVILGRLQIEQHLLAQSPIGSLRLLQTKGTHSIRGAKIAQNWRERVIL